MASELLLDFADGIFLVELATISDPQLIAATIAQVLGVKEAAGQSLEQTLAAYVQQKALLLR